MTILAEIPIRLRRKERGLIGKRALVSDRVIPLPPEDVHNLSKDRQLEEFHKCSESPHYFINGYCRILDDRTRRFIRFDLYPVQKNMLDVIWKEQYSIILKTRQVGASTLVAAYYLWLMLFELNSFCIMLSRGEREAKALMTERFKPMLSNLPSWMRPRSLLTDSLTEMKFSTNATILSLPTSGGDSYTARAAVIDEAALVHRSRTTLSQVLLNVQPTIDAGGQMTLVSKADKSRPKSTFNSIWVNAVKGLGEYYPIFIPWYGVPGRDKIWYSRQTRMSIDIDGTLDSLHESYPETWGEALRAKTLDKRFKPEIVKGAYSDAYTITPENAPDMPALKIFRDYDEDYVYIITADPAEGNPQSDPSTAHVYNWETGEQMAVIGGRFEIAIFAGYIAQLSLYYGKAGIFVERNNHGHGLIKLLETGNYGEVRLYAGPDSTKSVKKAGYLTTLKSKAIGYIELSNRMRDEEIIIHSEDTLNQLLDLEGSTLRAPKREHDDHAICAMLYAAAKKFVTIDIMMGFI